MSETFHDMEKSVDKGPVRFRLLPDNMPKQKPGGYAIYCIPNGKWYIGVSRNLSIRRYDHQRCGNAHLPLSKAIRHYGAGKFVFVPIFYTDEADMDWLQEIETQLIISYRSTTRENGYNTVTKLFGLYKAAGAYGPIHLASCIAAQNKPEILLKKSSNGKRTVATSPKVAAILAEGRKIGSKVRDERLAAARADPAWEAARVARITATHNRPDVKARMSAINREINSRPEVKAKQAALMRARAEQRRQEELAKQDQLPLAE